MSLDPNQTSGFGVGKGQQSQQDKIEQTLRARAPENGIVSRDKFNEILYVLEELGFPQLRDTPTGQRLFDILAKVAKIIYFPPVFRRVCHLCISRFDC